MAELIILVIVSAGAGLACGFAISALPHADPARAASQQLGAQIARQPALRRFLTARLAPETATGLTLTLALAGVLSVFVLFGVAIAMIRSNSGVVNLDAAVTRWAVELSAPGPLTVLRWITFAGSTLGVVLSVLVTTVYALRRWPGRWSVALFLLVVLAGQLALSNLVKIAVARVRPDAPPLQLFSGPSFPSGHATAAAAAWAAVALVVSRGAPSRTRAILTGTAAGIAVAVACSRVFLGAHWASDVVGGLLLGWTWFALCAAAFGGRVMRLGAPVKEAASVPARPAEPTRSSVPAAQRRREG